LRSAVKAVVSAAAIEASAAKKIIVIKRYRCFIDPRGLRTNLLGPFLFELCIKQLSGPESFKTPACKQEGWEPCPVIPKNVASTQRTASNWPVRLPHRL
jgi:hypothetical protein